MTKAAPLTPDEEKKLADWRRAHEENSRKINFYEFVKEIVKKLKQFPPDHEARIRPDMSREEVNERVFGHKNFQVGASLLQF